MHWETVRRLLARHAPECEVLAFGSRVGGRARPHSDLDLAVRGTARLPLGRIDALREAFMESDLPMRVDLLDWQAVPETFQKIIAAGSEVVQEPASEGRPKMASST